MSRNTATFSGNSKSRKHRKRYVLDKNFIKSYGITSLCRGPKYEVKELFQDHDFACQEDADEVYKRQEVMPYIFYIFSDKECSTYKNDKVKKIVIKFCTKDSMPCKIPYNPIDILREQIWIDTGMSEPSRAILDKDHYENILDSLKDRKEKNSPSKIYYTHLRSDNIWNEYCKIEGKTTMSRDNFILCIYRLNCLVFDLLDHPYHSKWKEWLNVLKAFAKDKYSKEYEYFDTDRWATALKNKKIDKNMAFKERLKDGQKLLNDFFILVKIESALEGFLESFYTSFAEELHKRGLLTRCGHCGTFIPFIRGKKYCSLLTEGRDCGKKARNKKYYSTRGKSRLSVYRRKTKALRKYYKEKGIKK